MAYQWQPTTQNWPNLVLPPSPEELTELEELRNMLLVLNNSFSAAVLPGYKRRHLVGCIHHAHSDILFTENAIDC